MQIAKTENFSQRNNLLQSHDTPPTQYLQSDFMTFKYAFIKHKFLEEAKLKFW